VGSSSGIDGFLDALTPTKAKETAAKLGSMETAKEREELSTSREGGSEQSNSDSKTYKRLKPRPKRIEKEDNIKPGKSSIVAWAATQTVGQDSVAKVQVRSSSNVESEDEQDHAIMAKKVFEKSHPLPPEEMDLVDGMSAMSIEKYTPYRDESDDSRDFLPPQPPPISKLPNLLSAPPPVLSVDFSKPELNESPKLTSVVASAVPIKNSTFVLLWTALHQLYGHLKIAVVAEEDDILSQSKVPEIVQSNAVGQLLERGFKSAEIALDVREFFTRISLPSVCYEKYRAGVQRYLSCAQTGKCPPLSSTQWKTLGIVMIDGVVLSLSDASEHENFSQTAWDLVVSSQCGRVSLDTAEIFMMREFFIDDLVRDVS